MRTPIALVLLALTPVALQADDKADEWKALNGSWTIEKATVSGMDLTAVLSTGVLTLADGKYSLILDKDPDKGTVSIDLAKKPRAMDIEGTEGPNKGKKFPAIYELSGDTLKICYTLDGETRPTEFESKAESKTLLVTYKRKK